MTVDGSGSERAIRCRGALRSPRTPGGGGGGGAARPRLRGGASGVALWMAEHIARRAPIFVKRERSPPCEDVRGGVSGNPRATRREGRDLPRRPERARAETAPRSAPPVAGRSEELSIPPAHAQVPSAPSWPPGLPPDSPHGSPTLPSHTSPSSLPSLPSSVHFPRPSLRCRSSPRRFGGAPAASPADDPVWRSPPPRKSAQSSPPHSLRPTAPPTARSWVPLPPPPRRPGLSRGPVLLGAAILIALSFVGLTRLLRKPGPIFKRSAIPRTETS